MHRNDGLACIGTVAGFAGIRTEALRVRIPMMVTGVSDLS
jgi:hypothetical protein